MFHDITPFEVNNLFLIGRSLFPQFEHFIPRLAGTISPVHIFLFMDTYHSAASPFFLNETEMIKENALQGLSSANDSNQDGHNRYDQKDVNETAQ